MSKQTLTSLLELEIGSSVDLALKKLNRSVAFAMQGCLDHGHAFSSNRAEGMTVIVFNKRAHDVTQEPVPTSWHHALDHDAFSSNRAEGMNVIAFNKMEYDVTQEPVPTSWHHALV